MTLSYNPTGNSIIEKVHRDLCKKLRIEKGHNLQHDVRKTLLIHNSLSPVS